MKNFSLSQVKITDGFFAEAQRRNAEKTLPAVYARFSETGRFKALKCKNEEPHSHVYWDSDVAKWLEAAAYLLSRKEDARIRAWYDEAINDIVSNQREDGYFNSHFQVYEPDKIYTERDNHELYCAGHLFETAVAASECLGDDRLLRFSEKYVDYIYERFVEKQNTAFKSPGHEEIELALLRLYSHTKKEKYKKLAEYFLNVRGTDEEPQHSGDGKTQRQSHLPVRKQTTAEGHAVRALYLYIAMADLAQITGEEEMKNAVKTLVQDVIERKMYVTGGTGSSHYGERFTAPYDLHNFTSYSETCASIALAFLCDKMLRLTGEKIYGDVFERVLYNGVLTGVSLSGEEFFYVNPLEMQLNRVRAHNNPLLEGWTRERVPITQRVKVFDCSCCPPNICRFFEELPKYVWYANEESQTLTLSQFISCDLTSDFADAQLLSDMPYSGKLRFKIHSHGKNITLRIRKPEWCAQTYDNEKDGYLIYQGIFNGEEREIEFTTQLRKIYANPLVAENAGKTALAYGPIILCAEGADNDFNVFGVSVGDVGKATVAPLRHSPYALNVTLPVSYREPSTHLYTYDYGDETEKTLTLIPYFAWANRDENDMRVWFPNRI